MSDDKNTQCAECEMQVPNDSYGLAGYHPFLFCELYKLGHRDPAAYLRSYGFERGAAEAWL